MPIRLDELRAANRRIHATAARTLNEAKSLGLKTAFLCHSHQDAEFVGGALTLFTENGWRIYVDWADSTMPAEPNAETATKIKTKIIELDLFLFLATPNSTKSKWCPWEIGYADAVKSNSKIFVIPTTDQSGAWYGNEYLQLYQRIDRATEGGLASWRPNQTQGGVFIRNL